MVSSEAVILVTGGTGSFGQAFVKEALKHDCKAIRVFSRGEYLQAQMRDTFNDSRLRFFIGDIRDKERLARAMTGVTVVVHAAALKRVEVCEGNPQEAYLTNVVGTANVVNAAIDAKVHRVLAITSDKAVEPINLYGATRLMTEKLILGGNIYGDTKFSCIRSGNFRTSRGNVIELWDRQMNAGCISITDCNMARYWIETSEIARFAYRCLGLMEGGEIFIPKMKEETIMATALSHCGSNVAISEIGTRNGEKLKEKFDSDSDEFHVALEEEDIQVFDPEDPEGLFEELMPEEEGRVSFEYYLDSEDRVGYIK